jgi:creatinine amidohydrolase
MPEHRLAAMSAPEARARAASGAVCLVPLGSLEQHGAHLPLATDCLTAEAVSLRAAGRAHTDVLVAPALWSGLSPHHLPLGATATVRSSTLSALLADIVASIVSWCPSVLVVNGHGGNRGPLITLGLEVGVRSVSYWELVPELARALFPVDLGSPGHAGELETSLVLALHPELVGEIGPFDPIDPANVSLLQVSMPDSGVLGDPRAGDADRGHRLLDGAADALAALLDAEFGA